MIFNQTKNDIVCLYSRDYNFFFSKPNVTGIAYGYKIKNGINTCEPSIHVFVEKKIETRCLLNSDLIPSLYKGIKTDVIETGNFVAGQEQLMSNSYCNKLVRSSLNRVPAYVGRVRPIQPGWDMSNLAGIGDYAAGTFGYIVTDNKRISETFCLLSVNKTFSNYNKEPIGSEIIQPSFKYGGRSPQDIVAKLLRFQPLIFKHPDDPMPPLSEFNVIDASIASIFFCQQPQLINPFIPPNFVTIRGRATAEIGKNVEWTGCFSGSQKGRIISTNVMAKVNYVNNCVCWFKDITLISGGAFPSDEGALVYDNDRNAIGLVFSFGMMVGNLVCNISAIEQILDVTLAT